MVEAVAQSPSVAEARRALQKLLDKYNRIKNDKSVIGNEKQVCQSLIVPLIEDVLHWDTREPSEFKTENPSSGKRIDYVVCSQGIPQFIVEAKALSRDIRHDASAYKQALEYGWSKGKDFAILTNFKQFVILACNVRFRVSEEAEIDYIDLTTATDEELQRLLYFEKQYWLSSGRNNLAFARIGQFKRSIPVGDQLLEDMKGWRSKLLENIKQHSRINKYDFEDDQQFMHVEEEVQKFIDRLIFICYCEDKELNEAKLRTLLKDKRDRFTLKPGYLLEKIRELFTEYYRSYDSDLFDKSDCDRFFIDDDRLMIILEDLREPKGRIAYAFDSIDVDILGKVYENFIGHFQSGKKRFKEKEDPAKRKKEGIYYTPKYIVDYIVNNTVREYVKGKSFDEISKVRILDPACGSGSFLLRAFDVLVEECERSLKQKLTYEQKNQLMLNCIYGVDLDERAVAIAKLNLSLKMAERGKKLPMLGENIRHGNSLISDKKIAGDYFAFVWEDEFKEIMKQGFDVVIGNPPWVSFGLRGVGKLSESELNYYRSQYASAEYKISVYALFLERGLRVLKQGGVLSFITPDSFLLGRYFSKLRRFILDHGLINSILLTFYDVFSASASTGRNVICVFQKCDGSKPNSTGITAIKVASSDDFKQKKFLSFKYPQAYFEGMTYNRFRLFFNKFDKQIIDKIDANVYRLNDFLEPYSGCIARYGQESILSDVPKKSITIYDKNGKTVYVDSSALSKWKRLLPSSSNVRKYFLNLRDTKYIYIEPDPIKRRNYAKSGFDLVRYQSKKIFMPQTGDSLIAAYSEDELYCINNVHVLTEKQGNVVSIKYLLALLNSALINYYYHTISLELGRAMAQIDIETVEKIPIALVDDSRILHQIENLGDEIVALKIAPNVGTARGTVLSKIEEELDNIIYKIYKITAEEKKLIEESNAKSQ